MPKINGASNIIQILERDDLGPQQKTEEIRKLLNRNKELIDMKEKGNSILHLAIVNNLLELAETVIKLKPGLVSERDQYGNTVAHLMVQFLDIKASMLLKETISKNPELFDVCDERNRTPLHYAALCKKRWAIEILPRDPTRVHEKRDLDGKSPFDLLDKNAEELKQLMTAFTVGSPKSEKESKPSVKIKDILPATLLGSRASGTKPEVPKPDSARSQTQSAGNSPNTRPAPPRP